MTYLAWIKKSLLLGIVSMIAACSLQAAIIYVDVTATAGANNGASWTDAYTSLNAALTASVSGDSIWVADGTYYPGVAGDNAATFRLKIGVTVLGGFTGLNGLQETSVSQRDFRNNLTILTGDLDTSGTITALDAYHVVDGTSQDTTAILDGFTVTGGNAVGAGVGNRGGGIFILAGQSTIQNCIVERCNASGFGAGIYSNSGGRYYNTIVRYNTAGSQGAGVFLAGGTATHRVVNCVIVGNVAGSLGGGAILATSDTKVWNCTFVRNTGSFGSAAYSLNGSVEIHNSILWDNTGSELFGTFGAVTHCIVDGGYGPGTDITDADPSFADTVFHRIRACSPAVDIGDSILVVATDFDGNPRPVDGDNDLTAKWDLGAFEAQVPQAFPATNPIVGPNPACSLGEDVLYTVTTDNSPLNSYAWSLAGGGTIDGRSDSVVVAIDWGSTVGMYDLIMVETNEATGCSTADTLTITLDTVPVVTIAPTGADSVCDGDSLQIIGSGVGSSFQWYRNGTAIGGATGASYFAKQAGFFNVILTDGNGCADSAATNFELIINALPTVTFTTSGQDTFCIGDSVTISGSAGVSHQWFKDGAVLTNDTTTMLTVSTAGVYNMVQTDANGCIDSAATGVFVHVNPLPVVSVNPAALDTICAGDSIGMTATAAGATAFQWYRDGAAIGGATTNPYFGQASGFYNVILTDSNGCQDSAAAGHAILVADFENPAAACRDVTVYLDGTGNATVTPGMLDNGSTDNCVVDSFALSVSAFVCADTGVNVVTVTVFDGVGNNAACVSNVTVRDTMAPVALCKDSTVYLDGSGNLTLQPAQIDGGYSDNCGIATEVLDQTAFACADTGSHVVMLTLTDVSGNAASCTATITIADSTRPNAACIDTAVFLNGLGMASISLGSVENGSTDNCGIANTTIDRTNFTCADVPGVNVTLSVTDVSGNVGTCTAYVRVQDSVAPVALCSDTIIYIDSTGQAFLTPTDVDNGSSDNCAIDTSFLTQNLFTCNDTGLNVVTMTIQDADTNTATCITNVTVLDTVPPIAACSDTTFYLDSFGIAIVDPAVFGINSFDNCNFFDSSFVDVGPYSCVDTGQHVVTLTVRDVNGRLDSCSGTVTVTDSTGPFVLCKDTTLILNGTGMATITANDLDDGTTDNCTLSGIAIDNGSFTCNEVGQNAVLLTATDIFGNQRQCLSTVTIQDTVGPTAACHDTTLFLDASGMATVSAGDLDNGSADNCFLDTLILAQTQFTCSDTGANNITFSAIDPDSNVANCITVITVADTIRPTAICKDTLVYLDATGNFSFGASLIDNGSFDNCPIDTFLLTATNFSCVDTGANAVILSVVDPSGNSRNCSAMVTVVDSSAPNAVCSDTTLYLDGMGVLTIGLADVAGASSDNCSILSNVISDTSFACGDTGVSVITVQITDPSGNSSQCSLNLTIADSLPPVMQCLDTTLYLDSMGLGTVTINMVDNGTADNCGLASFALNRDTFSCASTGVTPIWFIATDIHGNADSCSSNITVLDTIVPAIVCIADTAYLNGIGVGLVNAQALTTGSTDACGIDSAWASPGAFSCNNVGTNLTIGYVQDPSGNLDSCSSTVLVLDTLRPNAVCDSLVLQLTSGGIRTIQALDLGPSSTDNCGLATSTASQDTFTCADFGFNSVQLTLVDAFGNRDSCISIVQIVDTQGITGVPVNLGNDTVACNSDTLTLNAGAGQASYLWSTGDTTQTIDIDTAGTYWVDVISPQGCMGSDTINISTNSIPDPNLRTESGELVVCSNDTLVLLVDSMYDAYLWSNGDTTPTTFVTTGGVYSILVTDANGCSLIRSLNIQFVPFPAPNPVITPASPVGQCDGTSTVLDAGSGYFAYEWNTGQTTQTITAFNTGTYWVEVWNGFGCHTRSTNTEVVPLAAPVPTITQSNDTLYASSATSYQWYLDNQPIVGAVDSFFVPVTTGNYQVLVTYANGCSRISDILAVLVGISEAELLLRSVSLYPNPSAGIVQLSSDQPIREPLDVRVTDIYGREMLTASYRNLVRVRKLDLSGLAGGLYLVELRTSVAQATHKVVLE